MLSALDFQATEIDILLDKIRSCLNRMERLGYHVASRRRKRTIGKFYVADLPFAGSPTPCSCTKEGENVESISHSNFILSDSAPSVDNQRNELFLHVKRLLEQSRIAIDGYELEIKLLSKACDEKMLQNFQAQYEDKMLQLRNLQAEYEFLKSQSYDSRKKTISVHESQGNDMQLLEDIGVKSFASSPESIENAYREGVGRDELINYGDKIQNRTAECMTKIRGMVCETEEVAGKICLKLDEQAEQITHIQADMNDVDYNMRRAKKTIRSIAKNAASDRCAQILCSLTLIFLILAILLISLPK